jgi:hypothetical protein
MQKRRIPEKLVRFLKHLLAGRSTQLKFDDYTSEPMEISNGISQGDPILISSYIFYNSDLLELLWQLTGMGYVNNVMLMSIGNDFNETTQEIKKAMESRRGGLQWLAEHNSRFKISKLVIMYCTQKKRKDPANPGKRIPL